MVEKYHRFFYIMDMNKFETECNKYNNYISCLNPVNIVGNTTICGLTNKNKTLCLRICTFFGFEITTYRETFTINYRIFYSKNYIPLTYMGNSELVSEEINIIYSSDKELETNQVINEGVDFLREFKSIMDNEDTVLRNKQLEVFIKKHKIDEDFR